jgi:DnaJ-domain-containing protein 1
MAGKFDVDRGAFTGTQASYQDLASGEPKMPVQSWQFVDGFQQLVGGDSEPDPLFFVESWTIGVPQAAERFLLRQNKQPVPRRQCERIGGIEDFGAGSSMQEGEQHLEPSSSAHGAVRGDYDAGCPRRIPGPTTAQADEWESPYSEGLADELPSGNTDGPMTQHRACQLLGVSVASTRRQIRAAYRQKVSQWHPDRLERGSEEMRQFATEQMVAINQAYHFLQSNSL